MWAWELGGRCKAGKCRPVVELLQECGGTCGHAGIVDAAPRDKCGARGLLGARTK